MVDRRRFLTCTLGGLVAQALPVRLAHAGQSSAAAGSNAVQVAGLVKQLVPEVSAQLPGSVRITPIYDRSASIVNSVRDVRETLFIAFMLVVPAFNAAAADVSHEQLMHKIQTAKTRTDHEEVAAIYEQQARTDRAASEEHRKMEQLYRGFGQSEAGRASPGQMAAHCKNIAAGYARAADEHDALAKLHRQAAAQAQ